MEDDEILTRHMDLIIELSKSLTSIVQRGADQELNGLTLATEQLLNGARSQLEQRHAGEV